MSLFGEDMTVIQFLNTIHLPAVVWVVIFALIFIKIGDIGKNKGE